MDDAGTVLSAHEYRDASEAENGLGPQNPGDGPLLRRRRLHQSRYRATVLKLPHWGATVGRSPRPLGSVLADEDAAEGRNFGSLGARDLYTSRHAAGWGIDPRCSTYMTSSQALMINLCRGTHPPRSTARWLAEARGPAPRVRGGCRDSVAASGVGRRGEAGARIRASIGRLELEERIAIERSRDGAQTRICAASRFGDAAKRRSAKTTLMQNILDP